MRQCDYISETVLGPQRCRALGALFVDSWQGYLCAQHELLHEKMIELAKKNHPSWKKER